SADLGAFRWTPQKGLELMSDLLKSGGAASQVAGWQLNGAVGVSADGAVIVGTGIDPNGRRQAWRAQFPTLRLTNFPLANYTPYTAPIITVFDHSMRAAPNATLLGLYNCDGVVLAFTGDVAARAEIHKRFNSFGTHPGDTNCADGLGYTSSTTTADSPPFALQGVNYTGIHFTGPKYLYYDGHPGYDYRATWGTPVFSVTAGTVFYPHSAVGMIGSPGRDKSPEYDAYCRWHSLGLVPDSAKDQFRIYYLHLLTHENDF